MTSFHYRRQVGLCTDAEKCDVHEYNIISCIDVCDMPMEDKRHHQLMVELQEAKARYVVSVDSIKLVTWLCVVIRN